MHFSTTSVSSIMSAEIKISCEMSLIFWLKISCGISPIFLLIGGNINLNIVLAKRDTSSVDEVHKRLKSLLGDALQGENANKFVELMYTVMFLTKKIITVYTLVCIFLACKVDSAKQFTFRMYVDHPVQRDCSNCNIRAVSHSCNVLSI